MKLQVLLLLFFNVFVLVRAAAIQQENTIEDDEDGGDTDIDNKKCAPWDKWQASKCLWPTQPFSSLPKACVSLPQKPKIQPIIKQFIQSKQLEVYSLVQGLFQLRQAKAPCGYCSRKIRCRQRKGGEYQKGCKFIDAQIVNEECDGNKPCEITPILGACPPPVPMPPPRRRPKPSGMGGNDLSDRLQHVNENALGNQNLEIEAGKNASQGPPLWHCVRNKDGSKCLCCCGWYLPNASNGKCVPLRKDTDDESEDRHWTWSGLMDIDLQHPFDADAAIDEDEITEQIEAPPMEISPVENTDEDNELPDQMPDPPVMQGATDHQVAAPVTDTIADKRAQKKGHEDNEI